MANKQTPHLDYDNIGKHDESVGIISHLKNIALSCWYVVEDLWALIGPTTMMILRLIWRITKPILNWLWLYIKQQAKKHPSGTGSAGLHLVLIFLLIGIPSCEKKPDMISPKLITVELLPIKKVTNIKPKEGKKPQAKKPKAQRPKPPVKRISSKPKPPKKAVKPKLKPKPKKVAKKPAPKPKKKIKKKPIPQEKTAELNKLAKPSKPKQISSKYDADKPLSMSEIDAIRHQLVKCWRILPGARAAAETAVTVRFKLNKNASVRGKVAVTDSKSYRNNPVFKAAADNAIRAIHRCSPLKNLPKDKYKQWKEMEFNFDPKDMY